MPALDPVGPVPVKRLPNRLPWLTILSMIVATTDRLRLRWLDLSDAAFVLELVNDPAWLRYIGDRGVHSLENAREYIAQGPQAMYARLGYGLFAVERARGGDLIGMCGLIKRDTLPDVDIGYALLPQFRGFGFALEAAQAALRLARETYGLRRLLAITVPDNAPSGRLLLALGMQFERSVELVPGGDALDLYCLTL